MYKLEIAAMNADDARAAQAGGADSLEISQSLEMGGLTPDMQVVAQARDTVTLPVHVLVRAHARNFVYNAAEMDAMLQAVEAARGLGADGVVFGALDVDGRLHLEQMLMVARAAAPLAVTLHRALDACATPIEALASLVGVVPRVLTAGPAPTAWEGRAFARDWVARFGAHFEFVSSGGLTLAQLPAFAKEVQAPVYHLGGAARTGGAVDSGRVRVLRAALDAVG